MPTKKSLGEKLAMLAKSKGKSQTEISESLSMPNSQLNRFFRGHSDLSSSNLVLVMRELGIDIEETISKKIQKHAQISEDEIETKEDCVEFLFKSLDEHGKQAYLNQLAWAARVISKQQLPTKIEEIIQKELNLI